VNAATVIKLNGIATEAGFVTWSVPIPDDDPVESTEVYVNGGFYWLLANITIDDPQTMADECKFEWDNAALGPRAITLSTREHTHFATIAGTPVESSEGPRLVYQTPIQFWSYGQLPQGTRLTLDVETACHVQLIAIRNGILADLDTFGVELL